MKRRKFLFATAGLATIYSDLTGISLNPEKEGFLLKSGEARFGRHTPFQGTNPNDLKISSLDTEGQVSMFEYVGFQKIGPPLHIHLHQDEVFYVIEGNYTFQLGDKKMKLEVGDSIFLPRNIPHTWVQNTERGKLLYFLSPAGKMEEFFLKLDSFKGPISQKEFDQISEEHGIKNVGPMLTPEE
jgi:quercetin dioxygenase-like cupin family protein